MAGALNRVPEDAESAAPPSSATESGLAVAAPRPVPARPRPVSMPPQPFHAAPDADSRPAAPPGDPPPHRKHRDSAHTSSTRSGRSNRILGDYTVGKTLGAGSMGKVKLAVHNVSGEKVRLLFLFPFLASQFSSSLLSRSSQEPALLLPQSTPPRQNRLPKTPPRKSAPSARRPSPCYSTTPTFAACVK